MPGITNSKSQDSPTIRFAAGEAEMKSDEQSWENEGGHMSSMAGRVVRVAGADLPYVAVLTRHESEASESAFATMREAEAFIKRNTPVPTRTLSPLYDRPASDFEDRSERKNRASRD
jgi:hypothetical protein